VVLPSFKILVMPTTGESGGMMKVLVQKVILKTTTLRLVNFYIPSKASLYVSASDVGYTKLTNFGSELNLVGNLFFFPSL
jgi:hypothetical protein